MTCTNSHILGGLTLNDAAALHREAVSINYAWKNLYSIAVESPVPIGSRGLATDRFNFFCIGADYSPITLTGEKRQVGAAFVDSLRAAEPIELKLTTLDNRNGMIKKWFEALSALAAPVDGTVNPPATYAAKITVRHSRVNEDGSVTLVDALGVEIEDDAYSNSALYRPGALENSLSRSESAVEEVGMTFFQLDTFMSSATLPVTLFDAIEGLL
jgi:hypothetical protein